MPGDQEPLTVCVSPKQLESFKDLGELVPIGASRG